MRKAVSNPAQFSDNHEAKKDGYTLFGFEGKKGDCHKRAEILDADAYQMQKFAIRPRPCTEIIEVW